MAVLMFTLHDHDKTERVIGSGHGFGAHRRMPSERNGQPYRLIHTNMEDVKIRVLHLGNFMTPLSTHDER
ncbi:hypothetical protein ACTXT7_007332 [Hymenolepis weldensis]